MLEFEDVAQTQESSDTDKGNETPEEDKSIDSQTPELRKFERMVIKELGRDIANINSGKADRNQKRINNKEKFKSERKKKLEKHPTIMPAVAKEKVKRQSKRDEETLAVKTKIQQLTLGEIVIARNAMRSWRPAMVVDKSEGNVVVHLFGTYNKGTKYESGKATRNWLPAWIDTKDGKQVYSEKGLRSYGPMNESYSSLRNLFCFSPKLAGTNKRQGGKLSRQNVARIREWMDSLPFEEEELFYGCGFIEYTADGRTVQEEL